MDALSESFAAATAGKPSRAYNNTMGTMPVPLPLPLTMSSSVDALPIVLTATIVPNVTGAASATPETRLAEYRQVLQFCQQFAPVIFLENSSYPLERHPEFAGSPRLRVHRFAPSASPERGKGYQEFEMLDAWLASEPQPPARWFKLTGRYHLLNLATMLAEARREKQHALLIDQLYRQQMARTYLFCTRSGAGGSNPQEGKCI